MSVNYFSDRLSVIGATITLTADKWEGEGPVFSQVVQIDDVTITPNCRIELLPTQEQYAQMYSGGVISLTSENNNGVVTIYADGAAPCMDVFCSVTELADIKPGFMASSVVISKRYEQDDS